MLVTSQGDPAVSGLLAERLRHGNPVGSIYFRRAILVRTIEPRRIDIRVPPSRAHLCIWSPVGTTPGRKEAVNLSKFSTRAIGAD